MTRRKTLRISPHIVTNPQVGFGRATIAGTGTKAGVVAAMFAGESQGRTREEARSFVANLYEITREQVAAAVVLYDFAESEWGREIRRRAGLVLKYREEAEAHRKTCALRNGPHRCTTCDITEGLLIKNAVALAELVDCL